MRVTLIVAAIIAFIALGLFGFLYLLDSNADLDVEVDDKSDEVVIAPGLNVSSQQAFQGGALGFSIIGVSDKPKVTWEDKELPLIKVERGYVGVVGVPLNSTTGKKDLKAVLSSGEEFTKTVDILSKDYGSSVLVVPKKAKDAGKTSQTLVSGISGNDNQVIAASTKVSNAEAYFDETFTIPTLEWVDVGGFGISRQSGGSSIRHLGTDLDAKEGDPIFSINRGKVVFSGYLTNYGHTIIIDHGLGIFSLYLHLNSREVEKDVMVERGQKIGEAGTTGLYSIETHLHFSIRNNGSSLDPKAFIDAFNASLLAM